MSRNSRKKKEKDPDRELALSLHREQRTRSSRTTALTPSGFYNEIDLFSKTTPKSKEEELTSEIIAFNATASQNTSVIIYNCTNYPELSELNDESEFGYVRKRKFSNVVAESQHDNHDAAPLSKSSSIYTLLNDATVQNQEAQPLGYIEPVTTTASKNVTLDNVLVPEPNAPSAAASAPSGQSRAHTQTPKGTNSINNTIESIAQRADMYYLEDPEIADFDNEENDEDTHADLLEPKNAYRKVTISQRDVEYPDELMIKDLHKLGNLTDRDNNDENEGKKKKEYPTDWRFTEGTWINCDLRYFDLKSLGGNFDVVLIDPPWRIRGSQHGSERTMFTNSKFSLEYNTLSNDEILDIDVGSLSNSGFCFLWVINSLLPLGFECLNRWGYTFVDKITWVKKTVNNNLAVGQGYYFLHSTETCLIGMKNNSKKGPFEFISKVANDVIFAPTKKKSQKPTQIYHIIEKMVPGGRKVEVFARNHNIRRGWLSLGNQLGEYFDWNHDLVNCDTCENVIPIGNKRFKSRLYKDKDLCEECFTKAEEDAEDYFVLDNVVDEMVFHEWYQCNVCKISPLWGIRFHCIECSDLDLCEACYEDNRHETSKLSDNHTAYHKFQAIELPERAGGFAVHHLRCQGCQTKPIIGFRFMCVECPSMNFCQKCFFLKKEPKKHLHTHNVQLLLEGEDIETGIKCEACGSNPIRGPHYKCNSCFNYDICEKCYKNKVPPPRYVVSHKPFHKFTKINPPWAADDD